MAMPGRFPRRKANEVRFFLVAISEAFKVNLNRKTFFFPFIIGRMKKIKIQKRSEVIKFNDVLFDDRRDFRHLFERFQCAIN